jgi:uncharacterized protein YndB with AHSA1/START domain
MTQPEKPDLEITLTRTFRASPERVFGAWTDPAKLARWFGPDGFTTTTHAFDLRPGGAWKHTMRGPDGKEYPNHIVFVEVESARRLVYDHVSPPPFRTTVTFEPHDAGTRMTFRMTFGDPNAYKVATEVYGAQEGLKQTVARLAAYVDHESPRNDPMTTTTQIPTLKLERTFNAMPERLWSYWTDPKKYAKWFNPAPLDLVIHEFDVRPGGAIRFDMPQPDGNKNPQEGVFHEIVPHELIVSGSPDRSFLVTTRFEPVDAKRTRLRVEVAGVPPDWHALAENGWGAGFDKLEGELGEEVGVDTGFTIMRAFNAPPERVWRMWTTKEGLMKWWAVSAKEIGFDFTVERIDVRVGGQFAFRMKNAEHDLVNGGTYRVVDEPHHLAWTWHFDIYLQPGEKPYDVPIEVRLVPTPMGGTQMVFKQGPLAKREYTLGSRSGVLANLEKLAQALEAA